MTVQVEYSDGKKTVYTLYGSEEEITGIPIANMATGSFGVSPSLDVYYYTEGGTWTKNGEAME